MLEVKEIHSYYGTSHILFGISLDVKEGEAVCLLGRNGAGKTTTFRSIIGLTPPKTGSIRFLGSEIVGKPPYTHCPDGDWICSRHSAHISGPDSSAEHYGRSDREGGGHLESGSDLWPLSRY